MQVRLAFNESASGSFLVTVATQAGSPGVTEDRFSTTTFEDENAFLQLVVASIADYDAIASVATTVLVSIHKPAYPQPWVALELTPEQCIRLNLSLPSRSPVPAGVVEQEAHVGALQLLLDNDTRLADFLLQTPAPFAMLAGPSLCFDFINPPYVQLLGRSSAEELLGKPVRDALPEMEGQPFFALLDNVYKTGRPYVGVEIRGNLRYEDGIHRDVNFDFIYHPIRNTMGDVVGIMAQATDVTDRVLSRQVSESREGQLYRQWAELDTIYRNSPIGMSLVSALDFTILRSNDQHALLSGRTPDQLLGKSIFEVYPGFSELLSIYSKVRSGLSVMDQEMIGEVPSSPGVVRRWMANFSPLFAADGVEVLAIACAFFEVTQVDRGLFSKPYASASSEGETAAANANEVQYEEATSPVV